MNEKELREKLGQLNSEIQSVRKEISSALEVKTKQEQQVAIEEKITKQIEEAQAILETSKTKLDKIRKE